MSTPIDLMLMPLYAQLKRLGADHELAMRVCELAVRHNARHISSWRTFGRGYLIDMGLTAEQSGIVRSLLLSTRTPALSSSGNSVVLPEQCESIQVGK